MLGSGGTSFLRTKRCQIAVCPPPINHRRWVLTSSHGCLRILKCNLTDKRKETTKEKENFVSSCKFQMKRKKKIKKKREMTHKTIAFRSPCILICYHDSFLNLTKLLKIPPHCISLSLPSQSSDKYFRESGVIVSTHYLELPLLRHESRKERKTQGKRRMEIKTPENTFLS